MDRVLLFYPRTGLDRKNTFSKPPLSLLALVPFLREKGVEVSLIDQRVDPNWEKRLEQELEAGPLCVGISSMSGVQILHALSVSERVKSLNRDIPVVWGGPHPSILPEQTLRHPLIDIVVIGEGEKTFAELVSCLKEGADWRRLEGIGYKDDGDVKINPLPPLLDVETLPLPAFDIVNIKDYLITFILGEENLMIIPDRGCPHRCTFCSVPCMHRHKLRLSSPGKVVEGIEQVKKMGVNTIDLGSENFFPNKKRVFDFCELLRKRELRVNLKAACRIDYVLRYSKDELRTLRESGFVAFQLGAESGSDRILELLKKGITVSQILEANERLKDCGIAAYYSFMIGVPTETLEDVEKTIDLALKLADSNPLAHTLNLQIYKPLPGTELYDVCLEHGLRPPERLEEWASLWDFEPPWFPPRQRRLLKRIDLFSVFFDRRSVEDVYANSPLRHLARFYSAVVRWRFQRRRYGLLLEYPLLRWVRSILSS